MNFGLPGFSTLVRSLVVALAIAATSVSFAQRNLKEVPDTDVAAQLASFTVAEGFEVSLWAQEPMAAKPVQMNWDAKGRLWVVSSTLYPQVAPGQVERDQVLVLEDTDGDGSADKHTVFAEGLHLPTAVMPVDGGRACYVANATEVLLLSDDNGDGVADRRDIVLTGFGSEDTHHLLHTFRRGPGGLLHMGQSIYIHSHIETPHGVRRLHGGGVWTFRPADRRLEILYRGLINPWGFDHDRWGQPFASDGAGSEGINHIFSGAVFRTAPGEPEFMPGLNSGQPKLCGLAILDGPGFPDDWQGSIVANDFRGHRINRYVLTEDGSSYVSTQAEDLLTSTHGAFRPIDVRVGPDGALYVADWYNPIIQHGEVDFRDERRDHVHGRIWRIARKGTAALASSAIPDWTKMEIAELLNLIGGPDSWRRDIAKAELLRRPTDDVELAIHVWKNGPDGKDRSGTDLLHLLWLTRAMGEIDIELLGRLTAHEDHRVRAGALRAATRLGEPISGARTALAVGAGDTHPQVRLMAVCGLAEVGDPDAFRDALSVLDHDIDRSIEFRLARFARQSASVWLPGYLAGEVDLGDDDERIAWALERAQDSRSVDALLALIEKGRVQPETAKRIIGTVSELANPKQLTQLLAFSPRQRPEDRELTLALLAKAASTRKVLPDAQTETILDLVGESAAATELAGLWKLEKARPLLESISHRPLVPTATMALARLGGDASKATLSEMANDSDAPAPRRAAAAIALAEMDSPAGAATAAGILGSIEAASADSGAIFTAFLRRKDGQRILADALQNTEGLSIDETVAVQGIQAIGRSGTKAPELDRALRKVGGVRRMDRALGAEELAALVGRVGKSGDPVRGEEIYRRPQLMCATCHAIGEAGGAIGPDLVSIGASAPVDYLIESMIDPSKKIKEGYHTTMVRLKDGGMMAGGVVSDTATEIRLRDAAGQEHTIARDQVEGVDVSPVSLMPPGLTGGLREDEFVDLITFLSKLGKEGDFKVAKEQHARTWRILPRLNAAQLDPVGHQGLKAFADPSIEFPWKPLYSLVSGQVPLSEVDVQTGRNLQTKVLQTSFTTSRAGSASLQISPVKNVRIWVDQTEIKPTPDGAPVEFSVDSEGDHRITVLVRAGANRKFPAQFRLTLVDAGESGARLVGGR